MNNQTPIELFTNGIEAMKKKEYKIAETYFLRSLYKISLSDISNSDTYNLALIGSIDNLSLHLYPEINFDFNKERALRFYEIFSKIDINVSWGYAQCLIKGIFDKPNYKEALIHLSKAPHYAQVYTLASLFHKGIGLEKNDEFTIKLLKSRRAKNSHIAQKTYDLCTEIGLEFNSKSDINKELEAEVDLILETVFENKKSAIVNNLSREIILDEFFNNKLNIPSFD